MAQDLNSEPPRSKSSELSEQNLNLNLMLTNSEADSLTTGVRCILMSQRFQPIVTAPRRWCLLERRLRFDLKHPIVMRQINVNSQIIPSNGKQWKVIVFAGYQRCLPPYKPPDFHTQEYILILLIFLRWDASRSQGCQPRTTDTNPHITALRLGLKIAQFTQKWDRPSIHRKSGRCIWKWVDDCRKFVSGLCFAFC